jgi:hypothetical protein
VHLADFLRLRSQPAAGLFMTLTRRCPLTCAHCSTNSMMDSEQHSSEPFRKFAATFTEQDHPSLVFFTGGEALLRPALVRELAGRCRELGVGTSLISGGYFARPGAKVPAALWAALTAVDHVAFSIDIFHERQVSRAAVFEVARKVREAGPDISFQVVGTGPDDPYLAGIADDIRVEFAGQVPALVCRLGASGRGESLVQFASAPVGPVTPHGCMMAAWPVITFDGSIVACCNQDVVDGPPPPHLRLGHAATSSWPQVAARCRGDSALRALRLVGPRYLAQAAGDCGSGYCDSCRALGDRPAALTQAAELVSSPTFTATESLAQDYQLGAGAHGFASLYGIGSYAEMVLLGSQ